MITVPTIRQQTTNLKRHACVCVCVLFSRFTVHTQHNKTTRLRGRNTSVHWL